MGDEEQELLIEDEVGHDDAEEGGAIDKGVLVQLSRRDSGSVVSQSSRPARRSRVRCCLLRVI